jgi:SAM-dependent methyltransferase
LHGCVQEKFSYWRKELFGKAVFKTFDGRHIPDDDNTYHIVFSACVFHHIQYEHHGPILCEIYRIIKPGGIIIVFEHNPYNPLTEHAVRTCAFDKNARLIKGKEFLKRLEKIGFINAFLCYRIFFPGLLRIFRPMEKYMGWLPLGAQYYVSGKKP